MKGSLKKILALGLTLSLTVPAIAGCEGIGSGADADTIKVMLSGQKPTGWDQVLEEYNNTGAKETGVKLDVEWVSQGDYKEKLNLRMIGSENYDLVFDAPFNKLKTFTAYEMYTPLEDYLASGEYPNLTAAFPENIVDANYYFGHLYGLPMMRTYGNGIDCVYYRKDLAKKYNIGTDGQINSYDELQQFFDAILTGEEASMNMVPFGVTGSRGFYSLFAQDTLDLAKNHIVRLSLGAFAHVLLNEDNTEVVDIVYEGEDLSRYAAFPEKYRDGELLGNARLKKLREWNKYLERDSLNRKDSWAMFTGLKCAAMVDNLDTYEQKITDMKSSMPEAEVGIFILNDGVREMQDEARVTDLKGNNFICIPAWSKKVDKVLTFLDWLYADESHHDLFELGIEGVNWERVGEDKYQQLTPPDREKYAFPGYVLTWNPNFVKFEASLPDDIYEYKKYDLKPEAYYESPLAGFTFDTSMLQTETSVISGITSKVSTALEHGALDNPVEVKQENTAECLANGLDVIREEAKRQINEFLKQKNSK